MLTVGRIFNLIPRDTTSGVGSSFMNLPLFLFYLKLQKEEIKMSGQDIFIFVLIGIVAVGFIAVNISMKKKNKDDSEKK